MLTSIFPVFYQNSQYGLLILRAVVGIIFCIRGGSTLQQRWGEKFILFTEINFPFPRFFTIATACVEILGGLFLILGFYFQATSFTLAIMMLVAACIKIKQHDLLKESYLVYEILFTILVAFLFLGPGPHALELLL